MNDKPKSIWEKSWKGRYALLGLALFLACAGLLGALIICHQDELFGIDFWIGSMVCTIVVTCVFLIILGLIRFVRRLLCWRNFQRFLFAIACIITLIALFYAEEDWRGWHAWQKFKQEWEAKGEKFDMAGVIPPPVPEDQNFALTPIVASCYEAMLDKTGHEVQPRNTNVVDRLSMITWRDNHWAKIPKLDGWQASKKSDLKAWQAYFRSPPPTNSVETNSFPVAPPAAIAGG